MRRSETITLFVILFIVIEISCHAYFKVFYDTSILSIAYFISGMSIPVLIGIGLIKNEPFDQKPMFSRPKNIALFLAVLVTLLFVHYTGQNIQNVPIDYRQADMIPVLQIMSERFVENKAVYDIIPEIWNGIQPIYLPALWLPFCLAHLFEIDPRWITSSMIILSFFLILWSSSKGSWPLVIGTALSILLITSLTVLDASMITMTQEGIVIFYYVLLAFALLHRKFFLIGIAIGLCLLSRYALIGWAFAFLLFQLLFNQKDQFIKVIGGTTLLVIPMFWLTSAYKEFRVFLDLPAHYLNAVLENRDKYSPTIHDNLGLAKFVPYEELSTLNLVNTVISFALPIVLFSSYRFLRKQINFHVYSLLVLKISLVVFYNLLIVPYSYLFYTSTFLSLILVSILFSRRVNFYSSASLK